MGHKYVKEEDTFSTSQNGTVPKPTSQEVTDGKVLKADGTWGEGGGGGTGDVEDVYVNGQSVLDENKIAQITSYTEVTQAQYNALPASKLTDDIMYCITDAHGADGYPPLIYSNDEREVGVWRDGKPLYQKTWDFVTDVNIGSWTNVMSIAGLNIDKLVNSISVQNDNAISQIEYWIDGTTLRGNTLRDNGAGDYVRYLTLQYTKTTDTAGSGTWTTQGAYAHHYSTDEHVVGTWIDGKPLYEITISDSTERDGSQSTSQGITANVSNVKEIIEATGSASFGSDNDWLIFPFSDNEASSLTNSRFKLAAIAKINNNTQLDIRFEIGNNYNGGNKINRVIVTIRYTKTTD